MGIATRVKARRHIYAPHLTQFGLRRTVFCRQVSTTITPHVRSDSVRRLIPRNFSVSCLRFVSYFYDFIANKSQKSGTVVTSGSIARHIHVRMKFVHCKGSVLLRQFYCGVTHANNFF